jgi:hypothetical protein
MRHCSRDERVSLRMLRIALVGTILLALSGCGRAGPTDGFLLSDPGMIGGVCSSGCNH